TESNKLKYFLSTPSIIAGVPRVTDTYHFSYSPDDNYGFERNSITFNKIKDFEQAKKILSQYVDSKNLSLNEGEELLVLDYHNVKEQSLMVTLITYTHR
ncbi:hypothetical protein, partial [Serratia silvae]